MASTLHSNKKLFGHCRVEWQIVNFSLQMLTEELTIRSPEFTINGSEETNWCMNLRSHLENKRSYVLFSLRRSATDSGPKYTWLNLRVHCICSDAKFVYCDSKLLSLKNDSKYEVCLGTIEYLLLEMNRLSDLLTIVCDMIVYSNNAGRGIGECNHAGLKLLSKNMLDLYRSAENFDTKLVFDDNVILAHRAVLCARNEYLKSIITRNVDDVEVRYFQEYMVINFTDRLDYKGMCKILAYLYTGDMRHVFEQPSFAIYHCAFLLEINDIVSYYEPDKLIFKSIIDIQEFTYILHGYRFENSSLVWFFDTESSTKMYQLLFYPVREKKAEYIPLFTRSSEKSLNACFEFDFIDENGHSFVITVKGKFTDIDDTISGIVKQLYSGHNIFEVVIKLKLTAGIKTSHIDEHHSVSVSLNEGFSYNCLSSDLEFLFDGGPFADMTLVNNGTYFRVHQCILAARSRFLFDALIANEVGETIVVPHVEPRVLSTLLTYIYAGILLDSIDEDIIHVYKAAVWSNLSQLKSMCSDCLKLSSKTNGNIRCRVVRLAERYEDVPLMKSVLNNLFDKKNIFLISNRELSLQDAHSCRYCRSAF